MWNTHVALASDVSALTYQRRPQGLCMFQCAIGMHTVHSYRGGYAHEPAGVLHVILPAADTLYRLLKSQGKTTSDLQAVMGENVESGLKL